MQKGKTMIIVPRRINQEKDTVHLQLPEYDESIGPPRLALPKTQIAGFINRLTVAEARDVGLNLGIAVFAANYLRTHGSQDGMAGANLTLIARLADAHTNKRYRTFMARLRDMCKSENPDLPAVIWTMMEALALLIETVKPDWNRAVDAYAARLGLPMV